MTKGELIQKIEGEWDNLQAALDGLTEEQMHRPGVVGEWTIKDAQQFADFLIAVEAEMNKVSWPSRAELIRSSAVVIFVIFMLATVLFGYDLIWQQLFVFIGVRPG